MKFGVAVALLSLFLVTVSANEEGRESEEHDYKDVDFCNILIDKLIGHVLDGIFIDPMIMPEINLVLKVNILFRDVEGRLKLKGHIKGLSSLRRIVSCIVEEKDGEKYFKVDICAGPLEAELDGFLGALKQNLTLNVNVKIPNIKITIKVNQKCKVIDIKIQKMGELEVYINGIGLLGSFLKPITNLLIPHVFELVKGILENGLTVSIPKVCCEDHELHEKWCKNDEFAVPKRIY